MIMTTKKYINDLKLPSPPYSAEKQSVYRELKKEFNLKHPGKTTKIIITALAHLVVIIVYALIVTCDVHDTSIIGVFEHIKHVNDKDAATYIGPQLIMGLVAYAMFQMTDVSITHTVREYYQVKWRNKYGIYKQPIRNIIIMGILISLNILACILFVDVVGASTKNIKYMIIVYVSCVIYRHVQLIKYARTNVIPNKPLPLNLVKLREYMIYKKSKLGIENETFRRLLFIVDQLHPNYWCGEKFPKGYMDTFSEINKLYEDFLSSIDESSELYKLVTRYNTIKDEYLNNEYYISSKGADDISLKDCHKEVQNISEVHYQI